MLLLIFAAIKFSNLEIVKRSDTCLAGKMNMTPLPFLLSGTYKLIALHLEIFNSQDEETTANVYLIAAIESL